MKSLVHGIVAAIAGIVILASNAQSARIAKTFELTDRATGGKIHLEDFAGKVVFLDFFAYWCPPCVASSPSVEKDIDQYYETRGGNPNKVEVVVIGVNVEPSNEAATDAFINKAGLRTVANDPLDSSGAWAQFGEGGIPHFVIINGTSGGTHQQWEVLFSASGYYGAEHYRAIIDKVESGSADASPEISIALTGGRNLVDGKSKLNFGRESVGSKSPWKTLTVTNTGDAKLVGLRVTNSGKARGDFVATKMETSSLDPGATTSFKVKFAPKGRGLRAAFINVRSNDEDENPFEIKVTGRGKN